MFVSKSQSPKGMASVGGAFGRCLSQEDGALVNEISALIKEAPHGSLSPSPLRTQQKGSDYEPVKGLAPERGRASARIFSFQGCEQ